MCFFGEAWAESKVPYNILFQCQSSLCLQYLLIVIPIQAIWWGGRPRLSRHLDMWLVKTVLTWNLVVLQFF